MRQIVNAKIERTTLGYEDHDILTFYLNLDYGGAGQGFGGFALDEPIHDAGRFVGRIGTAFGMEAIHRVLDVVGVRRWEDLPGKYVRADQEHSKVHRIGNILTDDWLDLEALAKEMGRDDDTDG